VVRPQSNALPTDQKYADDAFRREKRFAKYATSLMPFPLAHPAAVLPFRRLRPLNFSALVIGAITPDLSYCFVRHDLSVFAHTLGGCFGFSLPIGWLLVWIFQTVRDPLVQLLPAPHRQALLRSFRKPDPAWYSVPLSLVIGSATHVFWDAIVHEDGWFVERSDLLQMKLFTVDRHVFRMYRLLWHVSSWVGLYVLCRAYLQWLKRSTGSSQIFALEERRRYLLWAAILSVPLLGVLPFLVSSLAGKWPSLADMLRLLRISAGIYLMAVSILLIAIGAGLKIRDRADE
jgi:hypothetical protein